MISHIGGPIPNNISFGHKKTERSNIRSVFLLNICLFLMFKC